MKRLFVLSMTLCCLHTIGQAQTDSSASHALATDTTVYAYGKTELSAGYPGGPSWWNRFLSKYMRSPNNSEVKVPVVVGFIVHLDGIVSDIQILDGPLKGGYREEAVRLIKKSGYWKPAIQSGHQVNSYQQVVIEF